MKILIIRFSSIGDIVLASPVFRCVKQQLPDAELHFLTKLSFKEVTVNNTYIDQFHYYDDNMDALIKILTLENFDHVIDLHNNIRSTTIRKKLKRPVQIIDKLSWQKFLLTKLNINVMPGIHITQRSLNTVKKLGVTDDGRGLDYFISTDQKVFANDLPTTHHAGFISIVIGGNHYTKKMPVHKLQELCRKINHPIILVGGESEKLVGEQIAAIDEMKIYNSCGKFSLNESADIIRQSKLVVSHDTGFQYIACAFQRPVIALWGGTSPKLDVEPYYGSANPAKHQNIFLDLRCQPCSRYGSDKCPLEHFNCMEKQNTDLIASKVQQMLGR